MREREREREREKVRQINIVVMKFTRLRGGYIERAGGGGVEGVGGVYNIIVSAYP